MTAIILATTAGEKNNHEATKSTKAGPTTAEIGLALTWRPPPAGCDL